MGQIGEEMKELYRVIYCKTNAKPVPPRARVLYTNQSIDRSKRRLQVIQSTNQSITYYWFLLIVLIKQSSEQSTYQSRDIASRPNQSISWLPFENQFSLWIGRGLQVLIVFCTVLGDEKSNAFRCILLNLTSSEKNSNSDGVCFCPGTG